VELASHSKGKTMTPIAPSVLGAAHWYIAQTNGYTEADAFIWRIITLTGEKDGSPVLALARRCNEIKRNQQKVQHRDFLAMTIKAWNLDAENKTAVKIATYSKTGQYQLPKVLKRKISISDELDDGLMEDESEGDEKGERTAS